MTVATKQDLQTLQEGVDQSIDILNDRIHQNFKNVSTSIDKINKQFESFTVLLEQSDQKTQQAIRTSTNEVIDVIQQLAQATHNQIVETNDRHEQLSKELRLIKASLDSKYTAIDRAYKHQDIAETEVVALTSAIRRIEDWVQQIAKETGVSLTAS